jgi:uncharacterized protein (DUF952 family)
MGTPKIEPHTVLHIAPTARWSAAAANSDGNYTDPSLETERFIHCSTKEQVLIPANERFAGRSDLVLLVIDLEHVASPTVFEDRYDSGHKFPHIYGPIPVAAVTDVVPFPCSSDGSFQLPDTLR